MGETTGSVWIGACCDGVVGCGVAFRDAVLGGIVDVTTDPIRGEAFCDAVLEGTVGVTTGP